MTATNLPNPKDANRVFTLIIAFLVVITAIILLSSCVTEKQRQKICANCSHTDSVKITKHDTILYRDTVMFLSQVGDTITLPCPEKDTVIIRKNAGIVTKVIYKDKKVQCICADDSLRLVIDKIRADHFAEIDSIKEQTFKVESPETWWQKLYRYGFWINLLLLILIGIYEGLKFISWLKNKMP